MTTRRIFLETSTRLAAGALAAGGVTAATGEAQSQQPQAPKKKLHILMTTRGGPMSRHARRLPSPTASHWPRRVMRCRYFSPMMRPI